MRKRRTWFIILVIGLLLALGGGYAAYARLEALPKSADEPPLQTATVMRGDIVLTAEGSGELIPASELELSFRTSGMLDEVLVEIGDRVQEGDLLARLDTDDLERAVAEADVELQIAELELADVRQGPSDAELADARAAFRNAQTKLALAQDAYQGTQDSHLDAAVDTAKTQFDWWVSYYQKQKAEYEEGDLSQADHDWAMAAMIEAEGEWQAAINQAHIEEVRAAGQIEPAQNAIYQAKENLELLESEPLTDTLTRAELVVDQALLARQEAREDLEAVQLYAPSDGTVMDVSADVGDQVGTGASILTLADLQEPLLRFWLEETDMSSVSVGAQVNVVFEALPDYTFTGKVVRVDPVLVTVSGTPAVQSQARLNLGDRDVNLLSGMTAEVEVVSAEARDALLVPVQALQETLDGQFTVFVVKPDGELETRGVEVGLQDPVNAEILEGLELGETVKIED